MQECFQGRCQKCRGAGLVWLQPDLSTKPADSKPNHELNAGLEAESVLSVHMCLLKSVGLLGLSRFLMWSRKCLSALLKPCLGYI